MRIYFFFLSHSLVSHSFIHPSIHSFIHLATTTNGDDQNEVNGNHQIVLLANEQLEPSDNEQAPDDGDRKTSNGATDEELTPLHWLHDKNLLKGNLHVCGVLEHGTEMFWLPKIIFFVANQRSSLWIEF